MSAPDLSPAELDRAFARATADLVVEARAYPGALPPAFRRWHVYLPDAGHSVLALLLADLATVDWTQPWQRLVPVPVKSALREHAVARGLLVVDLPYDPHLGLVTPPEDDEP